MVFFCRAEPVQRAARSVDGIRGQRRDQMLSPLYLPYQPQSNSRPIIASGFSTTEGPRGSASSSSSRQPPRSYDAGPTSRVCNLYLQSDTFLWDHVIKLPHIRFNRDLAIKEITSIFTQHVQGAQAIYQYTNFKDSSVSSKNLIN